jgi:predicted phage baseplate assembly protein
MTLPIPTLDDRRYADIVAEAKALIPRYTPEWNNFNESDPGITLLQLFAWMTEMLVFRVNQIPEHAYLKFLELLDIRLAPAEPARAELTFTLVDPAPARVEIPIGTRVAAASAAGGAPVVFETDAGLVALGASLAAIVVYDGFAYEDVTALVGRGGEFEPLGPNPAVDAALLLGFDYPHDFPTLELDLLAVVPADAAAAKTVTCDLGCDDVIPPGQLQWEFWDGAAWEPLGLGRDASRAFTRTGHISVSVTGTRMARRSVQPGTPARYWIRARLTGAQYDVAPRLAAILTNTVSATQAQTITGEVLGGSDGTPHQTFRVSFTPVLAGTLVVEVDEGSGPVRWLEVEDLAASSPDDPAFTPDRATGAIAFGDNEHGRIPVANPAQPAGNIRASYRFGGGAAGNLPPLTLTELQGAVDGVDSVTNRFPAEDGSDAETVAEAETRAPLALKARDRAVTADDFKYLAMQAPGTRIGRAIAEPLTNPGFPDVPVPGSVTVVVIPALDVSAPVPSEATLRNVCRTLDRHRLITTEVHVVGPRYRSVVVEATLIVSAGFDLGAVRKAAEQALMSYFHPLHGGEDGTGWPLGGEIAFSLVYRTILKTPGVGRIEQVFIWLDDEQQPFCQDVPIGSGALLRSDHHNLTVAYQ